MPLRVATALTFLLVAAAAHAEDDCGLMLRAMSHFRGTVRSLEPIARDHAEAIPVDLDPQFVVAIEVDGVNSGEPAVHAGDRLRFGIHSSARTFGTDPVVGRTFDFDSERMDCGGAFRRLLTLQVHAKNRLVETFDGRLEVGHSYRAKAKWVAGEGLTLVKPLALPRHHDGGVMWTNADSFTSSGKVREIVFEVVSRRIEQIGERQWLSLFDATLIELRPVGND